MNWNTPIYAGVAVVAILVVGATAVLVPLNPTPSFAGTTSMSSVSTTSTSTVSADGLSLRFTLNATSVSQGRAVNLTVGEWNTLSAQNEAWVSDAWVVQGLGVGPCGRLNFPFGFEIVSGQYYNLTGLVSAQKIQLSPPGVYSCPAILAGVTSYSFYPLSDVANITGPCPSGPDPCFHSVMSYSETVSTYWNGTSMAPLPVGAYTVIVGDEWGALLFGHFTVTAAGVVLTVLPAGATLQVSSSYDCVAGHYAAPFSVQEPSVLSGGFSAGKPGVTLYVATTQQASTLFEGHPSTWVFASGLQSSTSFAASLAPGSYVVWIEGADMNCGATVVMPLEQLTAVNVTQAFTLVTSA